VSKKQPSATASLMRIALGIDLAIIFFGALALRGIDAFPGVWLWSGVAGTVLAVLVLIRLVDAPVAAWLGHLFHAGLLGLFFVDTAVGLSVLVPIGFWLYATIRGPQLDRLSGSNS
jgi:hypothetical protein